MMESERVATGLDVLVGEDFRRLAKRRLGLLCHPASVDRRWRHARHLLQASANADLRALYGPQHGLRGETQDNMIEWADFADPETGLPVFSLYGEHRRPTPAMLAPIDTLVIDLQDVGARYYTFIWTMLLCLEACAQEGKSVVVLDRPNPLGGAVEGNILDPAYRSFVGLAPLPMRHGLTIGELARLFALSVQGDLELDVIPLRAWRRRMWYDATGLPWIPPSPNMPTPDTALVYPGMALLEGTELSEGRGTTRPFEIVGAPFIDPGRLAARLSEYRLPGCVWRPLHFEPTFQKHAGQLCGGVQVHVTERESFRPVLAAVTLLAAVKALWPAEFRWRQPPYEYEHEKLPIDVLAGGPAFRESLEANRDPRRIVANWGAEIAAFQTTVEEHHLYD
jgi:uncharacterized protein YbbC (DUF1343 family)